MVTGRSGDVLDRDAYFERWSALHGGYDPRSSRLTAGWLGLVYRVARPMAVVGVSPTALTMVGAGASALVVGLAAAGGSWVVLAAVVVAVSGALDNLDGAVAMLRGRTTRWGFVLDSVVDRASDLLYLLALWVVGAPGWLCVLGGVLTGLQEYVRSRAGNAGMDEISVVTVSERPTRVVVAATFLLGAGLYVGSASGWATAGAAVWAALGAVGLTQILVVVWRRLRGPASAPQQ